ncbi:LysR family transcriptional regulator [Paenactinomyces guangxiensis]|uniref:LysR family transcriptional regulator n=1 Tax=Paenactinomyces guangxiensis TaxID=1490290 RepID=A0A7W1WQ25_9BACL|nr:LysR family transcriptional regulator [Paenactinomyces guangxiensis]MBA4493796.1 LysR family transcriptional regulator [Paenactinomyces guangxiensis]MBH8591262.1 LysR family transcriptional regulator [Paenactinomyces guangxiensis]
MDVRDLQFFQSVARHKSVTKAAEELNYVQSNVTTRITRLEKKLKTKLFYRNGKGMTLTPAGRILIHYADRILQLVREAENAFLMPQGPLKLGSTESTASIHLPALLIEYHHSCPDVDVSLTTASSEQLIEQVLRYELDGAFVVGPVNHPDLRSSVFMEEELVLISSPHHGPISSASDLQDQTILVFNTGCCYRAILENWLRAEGVRPVKRMEFSTLDGLIGCVKAGLGVALVSRLVAQEYRRGETRLHSVPSDYSRATTVFIQRNDVQQTPALAHFIKLMEQPDIKEKLIASTK